MLIAGWVKTSLVDYPGKISSVIFTQGCNLKCFYCHNPDLIETNSIKPMISNKEVFEFLEKRSGLLDGVVITGGEPTVQKDLPQFLRRIKNMGFLVKLDTNGTKPDVLKYLLDENLINYIAMDIKSPLEYYPIFSGKRVKSVLITDSIRIIKTSKILYEFRTTVAPGLKPIDLARIDAEISEPKNYFIQCCRGTKNQLFKDDISKMVPHAQFRGYL